MKFAVEISAPNTTDHFRQGCLVYDETGMNLEGFIDYRQYGPQKLKLFYPEGTVRILCSLKVTGREWQEAKRNEILNPGDMLT